MRVHAIRVVRIVIEIDTYAVSRRVNYITNVLVIIATFAENDAAKGFSGTGLYLPALLKGVNVTI